VRWQNTSLLVSLAFLGACGTTADYNMPTSRMETAEVAGRSWGGGVELGFSGSQKVILGGLYPDVINGGNNPDINNGIEKNGTYAFNLRLGIGSRLEAVMRDRYDSPAMWGVKWQFFGAPRAERVIGWKFAVAALGGNGSASDGSVTYSDGTSYKDDTDIRAGEGNLLAAYRMSEWVLWYATTHAAWYDATAKLTSNTEELHVSGWSWQYGQAFGIELSKHIATFKLETGVVRGSVKNNESRTDLVFGSTVGLLW
jgi:hypothetical protein